MPGSFVKSRTNYNAQVIAAEIAVQQNLSVQQHVMHRGYSATPQLEEQLNIQLTQHTARVNKAKARDIFSAIKINYPGSIIAQAASADSLLTWEGSSKAYIKKLDGTDGHLPIPIIFDENNNATVPVYFKSEKDNQYYSAGTVTVNFNDATQEDGYSNSLVKALIENKIDTNLLTPEDVKLAQAEEKLKALWTAKYTDADTKKDANQYKLCQSVERAAKKCTAHWKKPFALAFMSPEQKILRLKALEQLQILLSQQDPALMQDARKALKEINNKIRSYASFSSMKFKWTNIIVTLFFAIMGAFISEGTFGGALLGAFIGTVLTHAAWLIQNPAKSALESAVLASTPKANAQLDQARTATYGYEHQANFTQDNAPESHFVIANSPEMMPLQQGYSAEPVMYPHQQPAYVPGSYQAMQPMFMPYQQPIYSEQPQYAAAPTDTGPYDSQVYPLYPDTSVLPPNWTQFSAVFNPAPGSAPTQNVYGRNSQEWGQNFYQEYPMPQQQQPLEPVYQPVGHYGTNK